MRANIRASARKLSICIAMLAAGGAFYGCAASTQVVGSWKSPEATAKTYNNIVVAAMTDNVPARQIIEEQLQEQLQLRGIKATKSIDLFPPSETSKQGGDADMMLQQIQDDGYDGIMTVAVVDEETETRYIPGSAGYAPITRFGWYGAFRGYYSYYHPVLYRPGYYTEDKLYFLESNLYDAGSENLIWSAQSRSYEPSTLTTFAEGFAEVTVQQMTKDKIIP